MKNTTNFKYYQSITQWRIPNIFHWVIFPLIGFFVYLLIGLFSRAYAQNAIVYPIPELGDCRDGKECYLYCAIPQNQPACWSYAKFKLGGSVLGENSETPEGKAQRLGITFPIAELGNCANVAQCKAFCENAANHETCMSFARKKGMQKDDANIRQMDEEKKQPLLEKAKTELGCTSVEACKALCEQNKALCAVFAKKHIINKEVGGTSPNIRMENLGCKTEAECKALCLENPSKCPGFPKTSTSSATYKEPYNRPTNIPNQKYPVQEPPSYPNPATYQKPFPFTQPTSSTQDYNKYQQQNALPQPEKLPASELPGITP